MNICAIAECTANPNPLGLLWLLVMPALALGVWWLVQRRDDSDTKERRARLRGGREP